MSATIEGLPTDPLESVEIRVRGRVQGVGFRPTVWRLANDLGLAGEVLNDNEGVLIRARGSRSQLDGLVGALTRSPPPLAEITAIETRAYSDPLAAGFTIRDSASGTARTEVAPDAATCAACAAEVLDTTARRYRYPFTNCTHCGPRLSIVRRVPYDRATTTMAPFPLCEPCLGEYRDPADRRFHAEATACPRCGPAARLIRFDGAAVANGDDPAADAVEQARQLLDAGEIVAIKAIGGYQLACDAADAEAVARLRRLKRRDAKPFALMAADLDVIRRYCAVRPEEATALGGREAPIVLLDADGPERLPEAIAPGLATLGFMLPSTPLHLLLLRDWKTPLVMTSGNASAEPQVIDDTEAAQKLAPIAPYALTHDRAIANRIDDSVVRCMAGRPRLLRRARGYAPTSLPLPPGFEAAPDVLAYGGELKSTFCLTTAGRAVLSQHQGDLEDAATYDDFRHNLLLYRQLFDHTPAALAADLHPEYLSTRLAAETAAADALPLIGIQHHHAHAAACMAENGRPLDAGPVLAIVLDGLGLGADGEIWGGEFLIADYRRYRRLATFRPVAMPGGNQASREPWRNLYAHLAAGFGWDAITARYGSLDPVTALRRKPLATIDAMIRSGLNSPAASSCGRLFDAVAAALGLSFDRQAYEGEAAARLEAIACRATLAAGTDGGRDSATVSLPVGPGLGWIEPSGLWTGLLDDLARGTPTPVIAARFHLALADAIAAMAGALAVAAPDGAPRFDSVALSGGCFQNKLLFELVVHRLEARGLTVLTHARVPANDGGLALGQAVIAAARLLGDRPGHV